MTIYNINITASNGTHLKRLKSDLSLVMEKSGFNSCNNISVETTLWSF